MKKSIILFASVLLFFSFASCTESASKVEDTKKVAEEHNDAKFSTNKESDAQFLVNTAEMNLEQIKLGELAQTNSTTPDVKKMGSMMKIDHAQGLKDLARLAGAKQVTLPTSITDAGQAAYNKLMVKKGKDFDKEYCDIMVKGHKDAVDKFDKAPTAVADADIKVWAAMLLPALRTHLDASITCQKKCEKM